MGAKNPRPTKKDKRRERREAMLDEALDQTFPASDPPAILSPHPSDSTKQ